jgi:ankyrin repeat protein
VPVINIVPAEMFNRCLTLQTRLRTLKIVKLIKQLLTTTFAVFLLVGCGPSKDDLAMIYATESGNIQAVKQHLADGADVNARDNQFGGTALHGAAGYGQTEIAELLLIKGAKLHSKDDKYGITPLHYAAFRGHKETAELLIAKGADVNAKNEEGGTPSHLAAEEGHKQIVELLIAKGADLNVKDNAGRTPLDWAATWGLKEIADLLRKHVGKAKKGQ